MIMLVAAAVLLSVSDVAAQRVDRADWRAPSAALALAPINPRLHPRLSPSSQAGERIDARAARLSLPQLALVGGAVGCVTGALMMGSGGDERDRAPRRFNGCILGAPFGMVIGAVYGLATGR